MATFFFIASWLFQLASADIFLAKTQGELLREDVKQLLLSELSGHTDAARLTSIESELRPMFAALPKNELGRLELPTVRYALHRHFLQKYGWFVQGLDNAGESWNASGATTVLKARAPVYILGLFEEQLHGQGMGLHELAVFAATLADLIHAEATGQLEQIYEVLGLPKTGPVPQAAAENAFNAFIVTYLLGGEHGSVQSPLDIEMNKQRLLLQYPNVNDTLDWVQDLKRTRDVEATCRRNPFVDHPPSFEESSGFALQFSHKFGSFQNLECHSLKRKLVDMEHAGSGRVFLSKFYSNALDGAWEFMESVEYLRNQGALDESDPKNPTVVISNYLNSRMNCLTASNFYAVCCLNECDGLLGKLEMQIAAPRPTPSHVARVIAGLQSDTVDAPRNLSAALLARLDDIAYHHEGRVPLHGRLFAQWMHHAYPRECPFPHLAGVVKPMHAEEFASAMGLHSTEATQDVMEEHAFRTMETNEPVGGQVLLPWTFEEELVAEHKQVHPTLAQWMPGSASVKLVLALATLMSFAVPLARTLKVALGSTAVFEGKSEKLMV